VEVSGLVAASTSSCAKVLIRLSAALNPLGVSLQGQRRAERRGELTPQSMRWHNGTTYCIVLYRAGSKGVRVASGHFGLLIHRGQLSSLLFGNVPHLYPAFWPHPWGHCCVPSPTIENRTGVPWTLASMCHPQYPGVPQKPEAADPTRTSPLVTTA